jgi:hypothetical protein
MDDRQVELDYVFDRLGEAHLSQAYRLLVPRRRRLTRGNIGDEDNSGDLRTSVLDSAEGGEDRCEPNRGATGLRYRGGTGGTG